jgi:hypothetical protein
MRRAMSLSVLAASRSSRIYSSVLRRMSRRYVIWSIT